MSVDIIFAPDSLRTDQDSGGGEGRQCPSPLFLSGNFNWNGGLGSRFRMSCLVRQPLTGSAFQGDLFALHIVDTEFGAGIHAEIELGQVPVKMLGVDMLVNTDDATLEDRKEPFKRIGVNVTALPFILGVVNRAMACRAGKLEHRSTIRHQAALRVELRIEQAADTAMGRSIGRAWTICGTCPHNAGFELVLSGNLA